MNFIFIIRAVALLNELKEHMSGFTCDIDGHSRVDDADSLQPKVLLVNAVFQGEVGRGNVHDAAAFGGFAEDAVWFFTVDSLEG